MLYNRLTRVQSNRMYYEVMGDNDTEAMRKLCLTDLFFLLTVIFKRRDVDEPWLFERCNEVQQEPDGYLDLWAREHYKSTIITFAKSIQDVMSDPEETVGIFSHTRPIAKGFLGQIMRELETNILLQDLFSEVLYKEPKREASRWSLDNGIYVKRKTNPKEATFEAWGLVDGQPTSKHFTILVYDDVIDVKAVTTPDQIKKATQAWELSLNLGAKGGRRRHIGTRYHMRDTYSVIKERGAAIERRYPATKEGTWPGTSVFLTPQELKDKRRDFGPYTFAAQMLQDPTADKAMGFKEEWLRFYDQLKNFQEWNFYILVDPAGEKKKKTSQEPDYTVIVVIGVGPDKNYYLVDGIRDRLNLTERTRKLFEFHRKYRPLNTGYEKYGKDSDIEHIEYVMEIQNYRFPIIPLGGAMPKNDRIRQLVPIFEQGRFWLPHQLPFIDHEKTLKDFVKSFITDEYTAFPVAIHDDMLDDMARILDPDMKVEFPEIQEDIKVSITINQDVNKAQTDYDLFAT